MPHTPGLKLDFGGFAAPLSQQLARYDLPSDSIDAWNTDAASIQRLYVRGVITGKEATNACQRLSRQISEAIAKAEGEAS